MKSLAKWSNLAHFLGNRLAGLVVLANMRRIGPLLRLLTVLQNFPLLNGMKIIKKGRKKRRMNDGQQTNRASMSLRFATDEKRHDQSKNDG